MVLLSFLDVEALGFQIWLAKLHWLEVQYPKIYSSFSRSLRSADPTIRIAE